MLSYSFFELIFKDKILPNMEPDIKLIPIMKLKGNTTVSLTIKFTLPLFELFCIPIISIKKKQMFNVKVKTIFLKGKIIYSLNQPYKY